MIQEGVPYCNWKWIRNHLDRLNNASELTVDWKQVRVHMSLFGYSFYPPELTIGNMIMLPKVNLDVLENLLADR